MLKRAKDLKAIAGELESECMQATWFPDATKWPPEHLSETKQLKTFFINKCPENWQCTDPEEIMKFLEESWDNCFVVGDKSSLIRVKFEGTCVDVIAACCHYIPCSLNSMHVQFMHVCVCEAIQ